MIEVICAIIAAAATVICAWIASESRKANKRQEENDARVEARAKQRAKEGRLQLAMIAANSELTVGVAMALKSGHCNGEVEKGLQAVDAANKDYRTFLEGVAIDQLNSEGGSK